MKSFLIREFIINGIKGFFNRNVGHIPLFGAYNQCAAYSPINNYRFKYGPTAPFKEITLYSIPIFLDTISPISGLELLLYLNDKSLQYRDFEAFVILVNADEESECFN